MWLKSIIWLAGRVFIEGDWHVLRIACCTNLTSTVPGEQDWTGSCISYHRFYIVVHVLSSQCIQNEERETWRTSVFHMGNGEDMHKGILARCDSCCEGSLTKGGNALEEHCIFENTKLRREGEEEEVSTSNISTLAPQRDGWTFPLARLAYDMWHSTWPIVTPVSSMIPDPTSILINHA